MLRRPAMLVFTIALAAALLALAGCGDDDSVSQEELEQAKSEAARDARQQARLNELREEIESLQGDEQGTTTTDAGEETTTTSESQGGIPSDARDCGSGIYAKESTTSCAFALNVAKEFFSRGGGTFDAFSPTTGQTYTMTCTSAEAVICTGGNDAVVYIASS